jgi:hypothetical protein
MVILKDPQDITASDLQDIEPDESQEVNFLLNATTTDESGSVLELPDTEEEALLSETKQEVMIASYATASATSPKAGSARHGQLIEVPRGTETNQWVMFVAPREMGAMEPRSEKDNALLWFKCYAYRVTRTAFKIYARHKYRYWRDRDGIFRDGTVNYLLVRR